MDENEYHESDISTDAIFVNNQEKDPLDSNFMPAHEEKKQFKYVQKEIKVFKCNICQYETPRHNFLKKHMEAVHERIKPFKCSICDFATAEKGNLSKHIKTIHEGIKPFKCNICEYKTTANRFLQKHIQS